MTESPARLGWREVTQMHVQCAFPMRTDAIAMSDCCRRPAMSAVNKGDGYWTWRCSDHEGMIAPGVLGEPKNVVQVRHREWMDNPNVRWSDTEDGSYDRQSEQADLS